jgi:polyhydroxybutyrate depolymerase
VAVMLAACRGDGTESPASTPAQRTPQSTASVSAEARPCTPAKSASSGDSDGSLEFGGLTRTYVLHVPSSYDGSRAVPLVVNLHGFGSNGRQQANYSGLPAKADAEGFIVVSPDGAGTPVQWTFPGFGAGADDVGFIGALLDKLEQDLCIDTTEVFLAGMSNGAAMTTFIAYAMPDRITVIAAVAATAGPALCKSPRPIPVITFRGTEDMCVPYGGGQSQCGMRLPVRPAEDVAAHWGDFNGCSKSAARTRLSEHVRTIAYSECREETAVVLFVIEGGGHTWPGGVEVARLGVTTREISATDEMWDFFVAQASLRQ